MTPYVVGAEAYADAQGQDHLRHQRQQRHRQDRHPPDPGIRPVRERAGVPGLWSSSIRRRHRCRSRCRRATRPPAPVPYMVNNISIGKSFDVVPNPNWAATMGIPKATVSYTEQIDSNVNANALSVLKNSNEIFDWADTIPPADLLGGKGNRPRQARQPRRFGVLLLPERSRSLRSTTSSRVRRLSPASTRTRFSRLGSGTLQPGCFFLPPGYRGPRNQARARWPTRPPAT